MCLLMGLLMHSMATEGMQQCFAASIVTGKLQEAVFAELMLRMHAELHTHNNW